ncbi:peptidylprolyl isomerase [Carboxylicivirga linearis]|uniref:Peptidylprolyl isomerase n=1 Tax=Carboxylicivirga linearis TaxID=1628157 RepID=A0ABS5JU66_9BACT|nr:peptidylprolyl isomerase [Carboxylicivirga linearis]MBS2098011.1 peptidylprolyl isomerase [Carboxylicivirga linearis]
MNKQNIFRSILVAILTLTTLVSEAQNTNLLTVDDHQYSIDEFNYIYNKNNSLSQNPLSKKEYIPLFVNYKLKVLEAMDQGYDTIPSFKSELEYYRNELAKPYLTDKKATEAVIEEAYNHLSYELNAYHILVKLPQSPSPADTLSAYNKIKEIQSQITDLDSFEKLAKEKSDCPSSAKGGNLGYFTGFMMVYPFEKAAYNTEVGQASDITRTSFGYHLIYVKDKRPNQGEIKVAHIMKMYPQNAPQTVKDKAKVEIDSIYALLQNGADFTEMVKKYTDDKNSLSTNGELPWFNTGRMVPEFADAAFALTENGQISEPVQTPFGWHIIKRVDKKSMKSLEDSREEIEQKIKRDERAYAGKKATINRLKKEYNYNENSEALNSIYKTIAANKEQKSDLTLDEIAAKNYTLASFNKQEISSEDFAEYLKSKRVALSRLNEKSYVKHWNECAEDGLLTYEKSILEDKYPEFRFLMNEYHDGLLIFEISQKEIWNKASEDTTGLENYFAKHKADYILPERFEGTLIQCNKKKDLKKIMSMISTPDFTLTDSIQNVLSTFANVEEGSFTKGQYPLLDKQVWGDKTKAKGEYKYLVTLGELKPMTERELNEVRGQVLSDYQKQMEENWIKELREKYKPEINTTAIVDKKQ